MALRFILRGRSRVKTSVLTNYNLWNPSSSSSSSSSISISSYLHSNASSIPDPADEAIKTLDENKALFGGGTSIYKGAQKDDWIISLAQFAVNTHNQNQNAHLQFVRVVGASHTGISSFLYHITLEATHARNQKIYHTVVWLQLWKNLMELLVWKPINDALSAVGVKHGDLKLHETVMLHMNQMKKDLPRI